VIGQHVAPVFESYRRVSPGQFINDIEQQQYDDTGNMVHHIISYICSEPITDWT